MSDVPETLAPTRSRGTFATIVSMANPVFIALAVGLPIGALVAADMWGSFQFLKYVHILTGALWTGIDLFMGFVMGPVLGGMQPQERVAVFKRLMPKMTFLMPVIAAVTSTSGIQVAQYLGLFSADYPWVVAALVITALLTVQGFGLLLPNEIRIFKELLSPRPNVERISRLGMQNARLGGLQGLFQLGVILAMAHLRY